jgi:hypothetical protein
MTQSPRDRRPPEDSAAIPNYPVDLGIGSDVGVRRSLQHLPTILRADETVLCAAAGFLEGRSGLVVATSQRLLFVYRKQTPVDVAYSEIRAFRAKAGIVASELVVEDGVGPAVIKQVHPRQRLVDLAALLHDPPKAQARATSVRHSSTSPTEGWRPTLRTKVSPLPTRLPPHSERSDSSQAGATGETVPRPSLAPTRPLNQASPTATAESDRHRGWQPRLEDRRLGSSVRPLLTHAEAGERWPSARMQGGGALTLGPGWAEAGEWLVATFSAVILLGADIDAGSQGTAAVTNRRIAFIPNEGVVRDWPFTIVSDSSDPLPPNRVGLSGEWALDFPDATTRRDFLMAVAAAGDLERLPSLRAGEDRK